MVTAISIHALRVEGDLFLPLSTRRTAAISIHALRVEGDVITPSGLAVATISIHALRVEGDLITAGPYRACHDYFYPRPPGGGRPA